LQPEELPDGREVRKMNIRFFELRVEPYFRDPRTPEVGLKFTINVDGKECTFEKIYYPDHISSLFDHLFDMARDELKNYILDKEKK